MPILYSNSFPGWTVVYPANGKSGNGYFCFQVQQRRRCGNACSGKAGRADAKTIAQMFAEQFRAGKPPVAKNGQYPFTFIRDDKPCEAFITSYDDIFMVTTISGNRKGSHEFY